MQSNVKNEYSQNEYENVNVRNVTKLMLGMLESFDRCKYMNVCKLLNLCMFLVEKLRVIEML